MEGGLERDLWSFARSWYLILSDALSSLSDLMDKYPPLGVSFFFRYVWLTLCSASRLGQSQPASYKQAIRRLCLYIYLPVDSFCMWCGFSSILFSREQGNQLCEKVDVVRDYNRKIAGRQSCMELKQPDRTVTVTVSEFVNEWVLQNIMAMNGQNAIVQIATERENLTQQKVYILLNWKFWQHFNELKSNFIFEGSNTKDLW